MTSLNRGDALKITGSVLGGSLIAVTGFLAINNESSQISVERINLPVKNLPPALEGYKIAQMSDFHIYPYTKPELIKKAVEVTNMLDPDLIVLTGDYVWRNLGALAILAPILAGLNASHGVFSVIGNHDIWTNLDVVRGTLRNAGLPVLENEGVMISRGKGNIYLAGLEDAWSGRPNLKTALAGCPPDVPAVVLVHEPDVADLICQDPRVTLQLSGHSHGGQVRLPSFGAFVLPHLGKKYDFGLYRVRDMWLYTNRGIGNISVPFRYNCAPEVTLFSLHTP